jgi:uncharacterized phage-associated protein
VALRFEFDIEKLVQALAYISRHGVPGLDKLKIVKLLYLADKQHLLGVGRPILGDWYACMPYGPVPSQTLNIIRDLIDDDPELPPAAGELLHEFFDVDQTPKHAELVAKKDPSTDIFSESELAALDHVITHYGRFTGPQLVDLTHDDPVWTTRNQLRRPGSRVSIPYEVFFEVNDATDMLELALAQQENRDFDLLISYEAERASEEA